MEKERTDIGEDGRSMQGDKEQLEFLMEQLSSFRKLFDTLSVPEKREYLRMILDKVVWDGEQAHIDGKKAEQNQWLSGKLFPLRTHRIAASGRTDDRYEFSLVQ